MHFYAPACTEMHSKKCILCIFMHPRAPKCTPKNAFYAFLCTRVHRNALQKMHFMHFYAPPRAPKCTPKNAFYAFLCTPACTEMHSKKCILCIFMHPCVHRNALQKMHFMHFYAPLRAPKCTPKNAF